MVLENCQIVFTNPTATYKPGQTVTGKVELTLNSVKKVQGIKIKFKGVAKVHWTEPAYRSIISYDGTEEYFNNKWFLFGSGPGSNPIELYGNQIYHFSYVLPSNLPASFESKYGKISYTVKVSLIRPWKFDEEIKLTFNVINDLNLNNIPLLRNPAVLCTDKPLLSFFCNSEIISVVIKLPYTGFIPRQFIPININIDNTSKVTITLIKIKLNQIITCWSQSPKKKDKIESVKLTENKITDTVTAYTRKYFNINLKIPIVSPSMNNQIIALSYIVEVAAVLEGFNSDMIFKIPITIGTIPWT